MKEEAEKLKSVSIIIPTLNEADNLPLLLNDLSEFRINSEVILIDSCSKDKTKDIAALYGIRFYQINKKNRGYQLNFGSTLAEGNWLLFLHADSRFKSNWSREIKDIIRKNKNYIYFFNLKINSKKPFFRILEFFVFLRCYLFKMPYGDQGLLIHKNTFKKTKGFRNLPIMEDFDFIKRIQDKSYLLPLKNSIITSDRKWVKRNFLFQAIKNWHLRRRWENGEDIDVIYKEYYNLKN